MFSIQELFKHLPSQRKLPPDARAKAQKLLGLSANKKLIQRQLSSETGKVILLKDLANVVTSAKQGSSRNSISSIVDTLSEKYGESILNMMQHIQIR